VLSQFPFSEQVSLWQRLPLLALFFAFVVVIIAIRSLVECVRTWLTLRRFHRLRSFEQPSMRAGLAKLERQCVSRSMRLHATFYFFAAVVFLLLVDSYKTLGDGKLALGSIVLLQMAYVFAYAFWCSSLFFVVHAFQWITAARVATAKRAAE
jgi:hypothetical protein